MERSGFFKNFVEKAHFLLLSLLFLVVTTANIAASTQKQIPRQEHPKPQFHRDTWLNLNDEWSFGFDLGFSGSEEDWPKDGVPMVIRKNSGPQRYYRSEKTRTYKLM